MDKGKFLKIWIGSSVLLILYGFTVVSITPSSYENLGRVMIAVTLIASILAAMTSFMVYNLNNSDEEITLEKHER